MSMSNSEGVKRWRVVGQRQSTDLLADGSIGQVVEVTFTLADGTNGRVKIPLVGFNADRVREAIDTYADHLDAVSRLEG